MTLAHLPFQDDDTALPNGRHRSLVGVLVHRMLPVMQAGRLRLILPNGEVIERRGAHPGPEATLHISRWRALWSMLADGEHGFVDSYLAGAWSTAELDRMLEWCICNEAALTSRKTSSKLSRMRSKVLHYLRSNSRRGSRRNIAAHYDLGNDFFAPWLDEAMNYSSALYSGPSSLEAAQTAKLDRIASLLDLTGRESVLEIGCGWGALAERLLHRFAIRMCAITLSTEQLRYARARIAKEIEDGRAELRLQDYRDISETFDRIVSVEMIEAVGEHYWPDYFAKLRSCLRKGGVAVLQAITIAEDRFATYRKRPDFIQRYIFPGGMLPTCSIIQQHAARAGLALVHYELFGDSYAKTLREWRARFLKSWPALEKLGFDSRFRRMWEYYLTYCEVGFRTGKVNVGLFKLVDGPEIQSSV